MTTTARASGTFSQNTDRQPNSSTIHPPTSGPAPVVMPEKPDQTPIAFPRSSGSIDEEMIARLPGVSSAPPMPCSARAATSTSMDGAAAQSKDATANHVTPTMNTRRRPSRSPKEPPTRMSEARVSV
jgi:hypothetical protein